MDKPGSSKAGNKHGRDRKARQSIARVACNYCRTRKLRCDELRPTCSSCSKHDLKCTYDIRDNGESERKKLRLENTTLQQEVARLREAFDSANLCQSSLDQGMSVPYDEPHVSHDAQWMDDVSSVETPASDSLDTTHLCRKTTLNLPKDCSDERFQSIAVEILEALATRSDIESTLLLARLRLGERIDLIVLARLPTLQEGNLFRNSTAQ